MSLAAEQVAPTQKNKEAALERKRKHEQGAPRIMVVDVETHDWIDTRIEEWEKLKGPFGHRCWFRMETMDHPRVIQLAWVTYTIKGEKLKEETFYISDQAGHISPKAQDFHGITNEDLRTKGQPLKTVLRKFVMDVHAITQSGGKLVAHNIEFDATLIYKEMHREKESWRTDEEIDRGMNDMAAFEGLAKDGDCTMLLAAALSLGGAWDRPALKDLYTRFVNRKGFPNAHDALADADACGQLYFKLLEMKRDEELSTKETPPKLRGGRTAPSHPVGKLALDECWGE